jgi:hypothetical protein
MDTGNLIITILIAMVLGGVLVYVIIDYNKNKAAVSSEMDNVDKKVTTEVITRSGNVKYIVDQVNDVNNSMYADMASTSNQLKTLSQTQNSMFQGLGTLMTFSSNLPTGGGNANVSLLNLPGTGKVDINLIKHVNATMGLLASDLSPAKSVRFCGSGSAKCSEIPNSNGDLYFTPPSTKSGASIILDAPLTKLAGDITMGGASILSDSKGTTFASSKNSLILSSGSNTALQVKGDSIQVLGNNSAPVATITPTGTGVVVKAANLSLQGDLEVRGTIYTAKADGTNRVPISGAR